MLDTKEDNRVVFIDSVGKTSEGTEVVFMEGCAEESDAKIEVK